MHMDRARLANNAGVGVSPKGPCRGSTVGPCHYSLAERLANIVMLFNPRSEKREHRVLCCLCRGWSVSANVDEDNCWLPCSIATAVATVCVQGGWVIFLFVFKTPTLRTMIASTAPRRGIALHHPGKHKQNGVPSGLASVVRDRPSHPCKERKPESPNRSLASPQKAYASAIIAIGRPWCCNLRSGAAERGLLLCFSHPWRHRCVFWHPSRVTAPCAS